MRFGMHRALHHLTVLAVALTVSACAGRHEEVHAAPSGDVEAVAIFEMHQGQGGSFLRDVFLQSPDGERVFVVTAIRDAELDVVGWSDNATLRLCAKQELTSPQAIRVHDREVKIEWACQELP